MRYTEIPKFDLLFFVYQYQYGHTRRAWYTDVRSMGISNFNLLFRLICVRIIDFIYHPVDICILEPEILGNRNINFN